MMTRNSGKIQQGNSPMQMQSNCLPIGITSSKTKCVRLRNGRCLQHPKQTSARAIETSARAIVDAAGRTILVLCVVYCLNSQLYCTRTSSFWSPQTWGTLDRKSTFHKLIVNCFLNGVVFMFWLDIVYIELFYCVINFELVWTCNKVAVVENAKKCRLYPTFPLFQVICPYFGWIIAFRCVCVRVTWQSHQWLRQ